MMNLDVVTNSWKKNLKVVSAAVLLAATLGCGSSDNTGNTGSIISNTGGGGGFSGTGSCGGNGYSGPYISSAYEGNLLFGPINNGFPVVWSPINGPICVENPTITVTQTNAHWGDWGFFDCDKDSNKKAQVQVRVGNGSLITILEGETAEISGGGLLAIYLDASNSGGSDCLDINNISMSIVSQ